MSLKSVVSTLPDPRWVQAAEQEISDLKNAVAALRLEVAELRKR